MSLDISMKALLESGVHFGHRTNRWNPKMKPFIFTERNGIHIIDLQQTVQSLHIAYDLIRDCVAKGGTVLFVGTKRQAQETIQLEAERCGMPYVIERWLPGTLTNWSTIFARIMELQRLEKMFETGEIERLVKKEQLMVNRQIKRLLVHLSGIREMKGLPEMIFIVDVAREITTVHEANLKSVPIVAMVDTNCDPSNVDYVVPSNDDAIRAIKLIVNKVADAVVEGISMRKEDVVEDKEYEAIGEDEGRQRVRARIQLEEDVEDEALLGAATLQKLAESKREQEELEAEAEKKAEEAAEAVSEAAPEEEFDEIEEVEEEIAEVKLAPKPKKTKTPAVEVDAEEDIDEEDAEEVKPAAKVKKSKKTVKAKDLDEEEVEDEDLGDLDENDEEE